MLIEKLDTPPEPALPTSSSHSIEGIDAKPHALHVEKDTAPQLDIVTEPSVHFSPYDTVYDETTAAISEIRYAPKISVEDKPPSTWGMDDDYDVPKLSISGESTSLADDELVEDLDAPKKPAPASAPVPEAVELDFDIPLSSTDEFEELK